MVAGVIGEDGQTAPCRAEEVPRGAVAFATALHQRMVGGIAMEATPNNSSVTPIRVHVSRIS